jgi:hypothetical protein
MARLNVVPFPVLLEVEFRNLSCWFDGSADGGTSEDVP